MNTSDYDKHAFRDIFRDLTFAANATVPNTQYVSADKLTAISNAQSATINLKPVDLVEKVIGQLNASKNKPPMPEVIMEREKKGGYYTTVKWTDGTYTTVKASEGDEEEHSPYMAFCAALAKKLYGSNSAVHRAVDRHMETYIKEQKSKAAAEKRAKEREAEQAAHERALLREAKRLRLKEEAKAYNRAHKLDEE